jgi:hypothetical protein
MNCIRFVGSFVFVLLAACHESSLRLPTEPQQWRGEFVAIALREGDAAPLADAVLEFRKPEDLSLVVLSVKSGADGKAIVRGGLTEGSYDVRFLPPPGYVTCGGLTAQPSGRLVTLMGTGNAGETICFSRAF